MLAGGSVEDTVTWMRGDGDTFHGKVGGSLIQGQTITVRGGEIFNVANTSGA